MSYHYLKSRIFYSLFFSNQKHPPRAIVEINLPLNNSHAH